MSESKDLLQVLWSGADILRGKMDPNEYKNYLLSFIFYKYLSDSYLTKVYDLWNDAEPESLEDAQREYEKIMQSEDRDDFLSEVKDSLHYTLEPSMTYTAMLQSINEHCFHRVNLQNAFNYIEASDELFNDLFEDTELDSKRLGATEQQQSDTIADILRTFSDADLIHTTGDVLGNAYEYLIGEFAAETGKKAGEFYTPHGPAQILSRIAMKGQEEKKGLQVYDPCMGSGSLLLSCKNYSKYPEYIQYYGQELMLSTFNLARMNMLLHGILPENQHLRNGDTLDKDWPTDEETTFDVVTMNPPYSAHWSAAQGFETDERFMNYGGKLAPKSKADYAFLLHGFYHLKATGTMAIVLPHGVLFRGGSEAVIRETLLKNGSIYAVIGLPSNLFYNTSIPTCILVLKKQREGRDVLFIDASQLYEKDKKQNIMQPEHIDTVLKLYTDRHDVDKQAHLASYKEIESNDFNLNIPRYVDTREAEPEVNLKKVAAEIKDTNKSIENNNVELQAMLSQLVASSTDIADALNDLVDIFKKESHE